PCGDLPACALAIDRSCAASQASSWRISPEQQIAEAPSPERSRSGGQAMLATGSCVCGAVRSFCSRCGTHMYIRVNQSGRYILPAGLFALDAELEFDHQIFVDKR